MRPRAARAMPALRTRPFLLTVRLAGLLIMATLFLNLHSRAILAADGQSVPAPLISVKVQEGLLTVNARDVPLADLLRAIGERAALRVTIHGGGSILVSDSFADVPLDHGIQRLVRGTGLVLIYVSPEGAPGATALTDVRIYEAAPAERGQIHLATTELAPAQPPTDWVSQALGHPERSARLLAMRELARKRDQTATASLAQILTQDADPTVRGEAAAALAEVGGAEAAAALPTAVGDQDPWVRMQAVRALGKVEGDRATQILGAVLMGDPDPRVRRKAAPILAALRNEEARSVLVAAALSDPDQAVRQAVTSVLAQQER